MIALPTAFTSRRLNKEGAISDKGYIEVANIKGSGCIRRIWFLKINKSHKLTLEINVDGAEKPQVLVPLKSFFGIMQDRDPYYVNCSAYTVLPNPVVAKKDRFIPGNPGYNLHLPIPFSKSCRIRVHGSKGMFLGAVIDWHKYDEDTELTPYRLHAVHKRYKTTPDRGQIEMANVSGNGFLAGFLTGYIQKNHADMVFHTGGITILLDGETNPHAIRGNNVEDDYGFSWGFNDYQTRWIGCPKHDNRGRKDQDGVFYRFYGPDPIRFRSSASFRAGCRGDDMETVVYYYKISGSSAPEVETPSEWQITGLFPGANNFDTFKKSEFVEELKANAWPQTLKSGKRAYSVRKLKSDHGWIDLRELFHDATDQSAYARTSIESEVARKAVLRISVDNWCSIWLNGEHIATVRHENELETARLPIKLREGANNLLLKTTNSAATDNKRLWAINCAVE